MADMQQHEQNFEQDRSSGGWNSQNLDSDGRNRMNGSEQSQHFQQYSSGGWGHSGGGWVITSAVLAASSELGRRSTPAVTNTETISGLYEQ